MMYDLSMLIAQIDIEYVIFPNIAKKNSAGDRPSQCVFKFFTVLEFKEWLFIEIGKQTNIFEESLLRANRYRLSNPDKIKTNGDARKE